MARTTTTPRTREALAVLRLAMPSSAARALLALTQAGRPLLRHDLARAMRASPAYAARGAAWLSAHSLVTEEAVRDGLPGQPARRCRLVPTWEEGLRALLERRGLNGSDAIRRLKAR